jgi:hypothetical protein
LKFFLTFPLLFLSLSHLSRCVSTMPTRCTPLKLTRARVGK